MTRNLVKDYDGFVLNQKSADQTANQALKKQKVGTTLLLKFWNGQDLYIKTEKGVKSSSKKEWKNYWEKKKKRGKKN